MSSTLLVEQVSSLTEKISQTLRSCRTDYTECPDLDQYLSLDNSSGIKKIFQIMPAYAEAMKNVGVKNNKELKALWGSRFADPAVRDSVEDLLQVQDEVEEFLQELETKLGKVDASAGAGVNRQAGDILPADLVVIEVPSGKSIPLKESWTGSKYTLYVLMRHFG